MTVFGFDGAHGTNVRPPHTAAVSDWAKDESAPGLNDGTRLTASYANALVGSLRHLLTFYGVTGAESDDTLVRQAIVAGIAAAVALRAPLASPALTGTPTAPTAAPGTNTTQIATAAFVQAAVAALIAAAPAVLDTLYELAEALGNDANYAATITIALAGKQPLDAELTALAGLTSAADRLAYFTGSGTAAVADFTAAGRALVDDADATAQRATLGLVIGTNVQAYDAELAALAGLTSAADRLAYFTGSGTAAVADFTAAGRALVDDADATAQRATLGLVIGTNVQAYSANLAAWSGLATATKQDALGYTPVNPAAATAFTAHQYVTLATLTDGANIAWTVSTAQKAKVTLAGNRTMNAVTGAVEGAAYLLWVIQDATGSRTLSWTTTGAGSFDFGTDGAPALTTTASRGDALGFEAITIAGTLKLRFMGVKKGFV